MKLKFTKAITQKIVGIEFWFLYTALLHNVTYLCMKFQVTNFNTLKVMPRTRFLDARTDGSAYGWTDRLGDSSITPPNFVCGGITRQLQNSEKNDTKFYHMYYSYFCGICQRQCHYMSSIPYSENH